MIYKKILILAPYPIGNPQHGGQKRTKAIYEFYKKLIKNVRFIGVYHRGMYSDHGAQDILLGDIKIINKIDANPAIAELIAGRAVDNDIHVRSPLAKVLMEYRPDIIHIEQPFIYVGLKPLMAELDIKPKLIFGSQNIEYKMKDEIFRQLGLPEKKCKQIIKQIKQLETQFSHDADLVVAVSNDDAKFHVDMGAKKVVVAPNGMEQARSSPKAQRAISHFLKEHQIDIPIVFVGSAHPPNWKGFEEMVGDNLSFLPPKAKVIMAGGVSDYFSQTYNPGSLRKKEMFFSKLESMGKISDDYLAALIKKSEIILLPITSGGGSNLKTAEAILSGKKIVATKYAFRAYEEYMNLPNIYLAETKTDFRKAIIKAIEKERKPLNAQQRELALQVQWKYTLASLETALKDLSRNKFSTSAARLINRYSHAVKSRTKNNLHRT